MSFNSTILLTPTFLKSPKINLVWIMVLLFVRPSFGQTTNKELNAAKKAYILSRFCTEVKYNFASYEMLSFNWDSLCVASMPSVTQTQNDEDFINEMKKLCCKLEDGHTYVFSLNNPENPNDWIRPLPIRTKRIENSVFVTEVLSSYFLDKGVSAGCEILEINNTNVLDYGKTKVMPYLSSSTQQWKEYAPFSDFRLTQAKGSEISTLKIRDNKGKIIVLSSNRNLQWDLSRKSACDYKLIGNDVGLLTIHSFQNRDFSREKFDDIFKQLSTTKGLVIDIRDNGGGNSTHADYVMRHFCKRKIPTGNWKTPMYIAAHGSWEYPREYYMQAGEPLEPAAQTYDKPVVLLVNSGTFSSAENFCVAFKGAKRGKIIGSETAGSTGNPISIDLGFGIGCCICTKYEWDADGNEFIGKGISPDIKCAEDTNIYLKKKDKLIDLAVKIISASNH